jgi:photosystem II biogenesis protein Psp29
VLRRLKIVNNKKSIFKKCVKVSNLSTVSDSKRKFYERHDRPVNSIFRRVVEELLVEMHLLSVNEGFKYDAIYALGIVSSYDQFMANYSPEEDKTNIFEALCQSVDANAASYRHDAESLLAAARELPPENSLDTLLSMTTGGANNLLATTLQSIASNPKFKYSRLFGIGLFTLLETSVPGQFTEEANRKAAVEKLAESLHLPGEKLGKDLDAYRSNLSKLAQMQAAMADVVEADRKKREEREQKKAAEQAANESESTPST